MPIYKLYIWANIPHATVVNADGVMFCLHKIADDLKKKIKKRPLVCSYPSLGQCYNETNGEFR